MRRSFIGVVLLGLVLSACGGGGSPSRSQTFTVLWENYDGTVLEKDTEVLRGSWPEYNGRTPQRKSDEQYSYSFYGWSPQLTSVYKDITYIAQYSSQLEKAKIVFDLDGGTTNHATVPVYSSTISASDFFFDVTKPNYSFRGWQYNGTLVFNQFGNKLSNPSIRETMTFVASYSQNVFLSITKNIEEAGDVYGTGTYDYYSKVELFASPNEGYTFDGWYYKNIAISYQPNLTYTVDTTDINIEARFSLSYYRLEIESMHPSLGSVAINDHYKVAADGANIKYKSDVLVSAQSSTEEYSFLGWYDVDGKLVSPNYVYNFQMPNHDYNLFAKWDAPSYRVSINKNRENGGTVTGAGMYGYSTSVTVSQTTNPGYSFDGWYIDGAKKGQLDYYRFNMPANNVSITASWDLVTYNVTYNLNGGRIDSGSNPKTYTIEDNIILNSPSKTGYTFKCWIAYIDSKSREITALGNGMAGDVTVKAVWTPIEYSIPLYPNGGELDETVFEIRYDDSYVLPTPTRLGYKFDGWKGNSGLVSQSGTSWKYTDVTSLTAQWSILNYSITYELNGGTNSPNNPTSYTINTSVVFANPTKTGYTFLGWYDSDNNLVTSIQTESTGEIILSAHWNDGNRYIVELNPDGGDLENDSIEVQYNHKYCLPEPHKTGYSFDGWFTDSVKIVSEGVWNYENITTLTAHWSIIAYSIIYELNGGTNSPLNPSSYTIEDAVTFAAPTKAGYKFIGWYCDDLAITDIPLGSTGVVNVEARWLINLNVLSVTSDDTSKGTVVIISGSGYSNELITVMATPVGDCIFKGWYHKLTKVSDDATYTFTMPTNDYSLVAHFFTKTEEEEEARRLGRIPTLSDDGKTITYGLYPQENINDPSLISALDTLTTTEANNWYLYNNQYYAKASATPYTSGSKFDNGTTISKGTIYWFKCEPIIWNVLSNANGEYYVISSVLLDTHFYYNSKTSRTIDNQIVYANDYKYSDIRAWLNADFYNSAFALETGYIQITTVGNGGTTTDSKYNKYVCASTEDRVFLPSYKDYTNGNYGFSTQTYSTDTRCCKTTDWTRARGACFSSSSLYNYSNYWTRSPHSGYSDIAWFIRDDGDISGPYIYVNYSANCVRPAITIKIS